LDFIPTNGVFALDLPRNLTAHFFVATCGFFYNFIAIENRLVFEQIFLTRLTPAVS